MPCQAPASLGGLLVAASTTLLGLLLPLALMLVLRGARQARSGASDARAPEGPAAASSSGTSSGTSSSSGADGSSSGTGPGSPGGSWCAALPRCASGSSPPLSPFFEAAQLPALSAPTSPPRSSVFCDSGHLPLPAAPGFCCSSQASVLASSCPSPATPLDLPSAVLDAARICSRAADARLGVDVQGPGAAAAVASPFAAAAARGGCPWLGGSQPLLERGELQLPPGLAECRVDRSQLKFCKRDGRLVVLGRGAGGSVVKASLYGQAAAAKVVPLPSAEARRAFLAEAAALHALRHPNIVRCGVVD